MQRQIILRGQEVAYTLRQSARSRSIRLCVYRDGTVGVSAPKRMPLSVIEAFIAEKAEWILQKQEYFKRNPVKIPLQIPRSELRERKKDALKLVTERIAHFNEIYQFRFQKISIRNQKTRWGSCSRRGNLSFSVRVVLLRPELADYLVVHELCHLGEFNHSKKFWALVARTIPNYLTLRKELRGL